MTHRACFHFAVFLCLAIASLGGICRATQAAQTELASVELLPYEKFDEYLPADALPHPWHTIGDLNDSLQVLTQPWAESRVTGNHISGKGVEIFDNSTTDGQGIGFGMHFIQAPDGPILLAFDMRVYHRRGKYDTMLLGVDMGRGEDHRI